MVATSAVTHAAYLRNRSYTKCLKDQTPYEGWFNKKPNVAHLREFGAPVWVLLQGQKEERKMLPKSKRRVYVGFDNGCKGVKYFNAETRKVLISRNFQNIETSTPEPTENIDVTPNDPRKGEYGKNANANAPAIGVTKKRPHDEIEPDIEEPRRT